MEKPNLNVMIFDDDQQPSRQEDIRRYTSKNRSGKPSSANGHSSEKDFKKNVQNCGNQNSTLPKQMSQLQSRIKAIQRQGQRLKIEMQKRGNTGNLTSLGANNNKTTKQIQQILMVVQKKIQIIIQESKKLVNKMTQTIQRRLSQINNQQQQKFSNVQQTNKAPNINRSGSENINQKLKNRLNQIQHITKQKLQQYQQFYKNQYEKLTKQAKRKQQAMMKRLSQMELKFANKINSFQTKQKQYVDWIHHLQAKLKQRKSKKMITITQQKPQVSPIPSKNSGAPLQNINQLQNQQQLNSNHQNNVSSANFQTSRANMSISDQNNSKIIRKHKIFGNSVEGTNKSVSPLQKNSQKQSPTKDSVIPQKVPQNISNQPSSVSSFYQTPSINNNGNLNFYSELRRPQEQKGYKQPRQQQQTQYKFADLNEFSEQYNQSQSDDFFAPIQPQDVNGNYQRVLANIPLDSRGGTYYRQTVVSNHNYGYQNYDHQYEGNSNNQSSPNNNIGEKVFSPFDLN